MIYFAKYGGNISLVDASLFGILALIRTPAVVTVYFMQIFHHFALKEYVILSLLDFKTMVISENSLITLTMVLIECFNY